MAQPMKERMLRPICLWSAPVFLALAGLAATWNVWIVPKTLSRPSVSPEEAGHTYVTWAGPEADRYMAIWLIKRFIDPKATFVFLPIGSEIPPGRDTAFDVPGGKWFRGGRQSTAETIRNEIKLSDPVVDHMVRMVRTLEMAYWLVDPLSDAGRMDSAIRQMTSGASINEEQLNKVLEYFDVVYRAKGRIRE